MAMTKLRLPFWMFVLDAQCSTKVHEDIVTLVGPHHTRRRGEWGSLDGLQVRGNGNGHEYVTTTANTSARHPGILVHCGRCETIVIVLCCQ